MDHGHSTDMLITIVIAVFAGMSLIVIARRFNLPAIVLLLLGGVGLGPAGLALFDASSLGDGLSVMVSLAVGVILFEGGLTLERNGYRSASRVIKRLLSIGALTTWLGCSLAVWLIAGIKMEFAMLAGSLVIVTGPTVITPLLKRIRIQPRLHNILHWEGVLIDPIGVFIAVLSVEWVVGGGGSSAVVGFALRIGSGLGVGLLGGALLSLSARRNVVPHDLINSFMLAGAVLIFGVAEVLQSESGLLSVVIAGFFVGVTKPRQLMQIREFKAALTDLLIGGLFILLASRLTLEQFQAFGLPGFLAVAAVVLLVRPTGVVLCTWGSDLTMRDRAFLSWIAPRGIVAASMASLIRIQMEGLGHVETAAFIESFTYSIIVATIVIQGSSAGWLARVLKLNRAVSGGWLVVGGHAFGRRIAEFLAKETPSRAIVVDTNARMIRDAENDGLEAIRADARNADLYERPELQDVGNVLALTDNEDLNEVVCHRWHDVVGAAGLHRWCTPSRDGRESDEESGEGIWSYLPIPSLLSAELESGDSVLVRCEGDTPPSDPTDAMIILVTKGGEVVLDPRSRGELDLTEAALVLYLSRAAHYLLRSVRPELIIDSGARDLEALFTEMIGEVVRVHPQLPREETIKDLLEREGAFPTALGHGVSVPHTYSQNVAARICAIARLKEGIDVGAADGKPVNLVFLLISPQGDPSGHLASLGEIARLTIDAENRRRLLAARTPEEVLAIVRAVTTGI